MEMKGSYLAHGSEQQMKSRKSGNLMLVVLLLTGCSVSKTERESIPRDAKSITVTIESKKPETTEPPFAATAEKNTFALFYGTPYPTSADVELTERYAKITVISILALWILSLLFWFKNWERILSRLEGIGFREYRFIFMSTQISSVDNDKIAWLAIVPAAIVAGLVYVAIVCVYCYVGGIPPATAFIELNALISRIELNSHIFAVQPWVSIVIVVIFFGLTVLGIDGLTRSRIGRLLSKTNRAFELSPTQKHSTHPLGEQLREADNRVRSLAKQLGIEPPGDSSTRINKAISDNFEIFKGKDFLGSTLSTIVLEGPGQEMVRTYISKVLEERKEKITELEKLETAFDAAQQALSFTRAKVEKANNAILRQNLDGISKLIESGKELLKENVWHVDGFVALMDEAISELDRLYQSASVQDGSNQWQSSPQATSDPYVILGISQTMSDEEIKRVYRELCGIYHPDKGKVKDDSRFKEIQNAYEQLKKIRKAQG